MLWKNNILAILLTGKSNVLGIEQNLYIVSPDDKNQIQALMVKIKFMNYKDFQT